MRQRISLDPERAALLLVDLQEEQRLDPLYKVEGMSGVLANARLLLETARARNVPVFHAAYRRDFETRPPRPFEPRGENGSAAFSDRKSPLTAICSEVEPRAGEAVIWKNDASAFCEGDLRPMIESCGVEWLFVAGVWTEACIAATARDAMALGLRVLLVKDACGSGTEAMHQVAILNLANRLYGGGVADTARAVALLGGRPADVWMPERPVPIMFRLEDVADHFDRL